MPIPDTVQIGGPLAPTETTDLYPTHIDHYGKGGYRAVANATARDAIPALRRVAGMLVKTLDTGLIYALGADLLTWTAESFGGGGLIWEVVTANTQAVVGHGYIIDATAGPVTVTLPENPTSGDSVGVGAINTTYTATINRNGQRILGTITDMTLASAGGGIVLVFAGVSYGWTSGSELISGNGTGGGGGLIWEVVTADTLAIVGHGYLIDATAGPVAVTLPELPVPGESVGVGAINVTFTASILRNGKRILGTITDMTLASAGGGIVLVYSGVNFGWTSVSELVSEGVGGGGGGSGVTDGDKGDVTVSNSGATWLCPGITARLDALEYVAPDITSLTNDVGTVEIGTTVTDVVLNWAINKVVTSQSFSGGIGAIDPSLRTLALTGLSLTTATTYTLTAGDGTNTDAASTSIAFRHRRRWGESVTATADSTLIDALAGAEFSTSRAQSRTMSPAAAYLYFAWPSSFGTPTFTVNGLPVSGWVKTTVSYTNPSGDTTYFDVYRSQYLLTGTFSVVVS